MNTKIANQADATPNSASLSFAFDVGHSSIGWAVLTEPNARVPAILGTGVVLFEKDSALPSQRRLHRQQRRHVRATRQRVARIERVLVHLGLLTESTIKAKHQAAGGHAAPWLLAARVLASNGQRLLDWPQLWDVVRWYAHNRGYEPIGEDPDAKENEEKRQAAREGMAQTDRSTMCETICAWLELDPLAEKLATTTSYKSHGAAFDRDVVVAEVRKLLEHHSGHLPGLDDRLIALLLDEARVMEIPYLCFPLRYKGGLLFGRLQMRYNNRIIGRCSILAEELYRKYQADGLPDAEARAKSLQQAKVPSRDCPEFLRFRWAMLLANMMIATDGDSELRPLHIEEIQKLNALAEAQGYFTPGQFRREARALLECKRDNFAHMFMDSTAEQNLVLDPARKLVGSKAYLKDAWPHLPEPIRNRALNRLRRGRLQTLSSLRAEAITAGHDVSAFDEALDATCKAPPKRTRKPRKGALPPPTATEVLAAEYRMAKLGGRAPYSREIMKRATAEVMTGRHPREQGGCLFETPELRRFRETRSLDQQTNNHLVRHRLKILGRLLDELIADPAYAAGKPEQVARLTIEVNRDLREWSGLTAKEIAKEMNDRLSSHSKVARRLLADLPPEYHSRINASLIRKARVADDLGWCCPYTGVDFDPIDLVTKQVDLDHILPRSQRRSDSLDSLVVTFAEVNRWKGARTAWEFMQEHESQAVPGRQNLELKQLSRYRADVEALDKRGHPDDQRRKRNRIDKLLLENFDEKSAGFTPGQLTQTSQITRLGQQVLRAPFLELANPPMFTALPGQVTARARAAWDVIGCLATAAPGICNPDGSTKTKTEIRGITHLHHALDACVIGLAASRFEGDGSNAGAVWAALLERRPNATQRKLLESLDLVDFDHSGGFRLRDLPNELKEQIRQRLAELRVVQHVPADMSGIRVEENTRGIVRREDGRVFLRQSKRSENGHHEINYTNELEIKTLGIATGPTMTNGKLAKIKGGRVIVDNFGVAILHDASLPPEQRFVIIPFARVWQQLQELAIRNGGTPPEVWRNGQGFDYPKGNRKGKWRIFSIKNSAQKGVVLDVGRIHETKATWREVILRSILRDGAVRFPSSLIGN